MQNGVYTKMYLRAGHGVMPVTPVLRRMRQEDCYEFRAKLVLVSKKKILKNKNKDISDVSKYRLFLEKKYFVFQCGKQF